MVDIDLTTKMGPLAFKNPVLPGSAEIACDVKTVQKCIDNGVGGIVTKSYTTIPPMTTRSRPCQFFYGKFGKGFEYSWLTSIRLDTVLGDKASEKILPEMAKLCKKAQIPLVVNVCQATNPEDWVYLSRKTYEAGADALELNFGCPQTEFLKGKVPVGVTLGEKLELSSEIVRLVKKEVGCPVWVKSSAIYSPPEKYVLAWTDAGADAITAHAPPLGIYLDVERETPFGAPFIVAYMPGRSFLPISLAKIVQMRGVIPDTPISGVGGVFNAEDVLQYLLIGCKTAQVVSAIYQRGYGTFRKMIEGVKEWMEKKGYSVVDQFIGKAYRRIGLPSPEAYPIPCLSPEEETRYIPEVDTEKCNLCGICERTCFYDVMKIDRATEKIEEDYEGKCWGCGACVGLCPLGAVKLVDRKTKRTIWANEGIAETLEPLPPTV